MEELPEAVRDWRYVCLILINEYGWKYNLPRDVLMKDGYEMPMKPFRSYLPGSANSQSR